jgi:hypothetical protein
VYEGCKDQEDWREENRSGRAVTWEGERRRVAGQVGEKCGVVVCVLRVVSFKVGRGGEGKGANGVEDGSEQVDPGGGVQSLVFAALPGIGELGI